MHSSYSTTYETGIGVGAEVCNRAIQGSMSIAGWRARFFNVFQPFCVSSHSPPIEPVTPKLPLQHWAGSRRISNPDKVPCGVHTEERGSILARVRPVVTQQANFSPHVRDGPRDPSPTAWCHSHLLRLVIGRLRIRRLRHGSVAASPDGAAGDGRPCHRRRDKQRLHLRRGHPAAATFRRRVHGMHSPKSRWVSGAS